MDLRPRMNAISPGQKHVASTDPLAHYVPTSHAGVEIGGGAGLHYHYGTLEQLEHGVCCAEAYLDSVGQRRRLERPLSKWPYPADSGKRVRLFVLAGHRNMEGERRESQKPSFSVSSFPLCFKHIRHESSDEQFTSESPALRCRGHRSGDNAAPEICRSASGDRSQAGAKVLHSDHARAPGRARCCN